MQRITHEIVKLELADSPSLGLAVHLKKFCKSIKLRNLGVIVNSNGPKYLLKEELSQNMERVDL